MMQNLVARVMRRVFIRWPRLYQSQFVRRFYWDHLAKDIDARWGKGRSDWDVIAAVIARTNTHRILDVGCGSGRLFPLYLQLQIKEVVGQDLSSQALLMIDPRQFSGVNVRLTDTIIPRLDYSDHYFDLAISNRTLQHVPPDEIEQMVASLCRLCKNAYINELSDTDDLLPTPVMHVHDYRRLFANCDFAVRDSGLLGKQTWFLFGAARS